jgi:hypothetical protein
MASGKEPKPVSNLEKRIATLIRTSTADQGAIVVHCTAMDTIRSSYLRWLVLRAIPSAGPAITRIEIHNATISGEFDLRGAEVTIILRFVRCRFPELVHLTDANIIGIDFVGGEVREISADRLSAAGSLRLLAPKFVSYAEFIDNEESRVGVRVKQIRLCGAKINGNLDFRGSRLGEANTARPLFADGIHVKGNILLSKGLRANGEVWLNGATVDRNLDCSGSTFVNHNGYSLSAAGATVGGAVLLCQQYWRDKDDDHDDRARRFHSEGVVRFDGAKISGNLNCDNGKFTATAFAIENWRPDNELNDDRSDSSARPFHAFKAYGANIGGDVSFESDVQHSEYSFDVSGTISIIGAQIGGDFYLSNARLNFPGEDTVIADVVTVDGTTFLDNTYSNGMLRFAQANLKQGLFVTGATFDVRRPSKHWADDQSDTDEDLGGPACGLYAPFAQVTGTFAWQKIRKLPATDKGEILLWVHLFGSSGTTVQDDEQSWTVVDRFDLTGAQYVSIAHLSGSDVKWRLREFDRQYALFNHRRYCDVVVSAHLFWNRLRHVFDSFGAPSPSQNSTDQFTTASEPEPVLRTRDQNLSENQREREKTIREAVRRFKPQPYLQLARTYRLAGYPSATRDVLVRLERNQTRYSDISFAQMLWRWLLDLTIQYGHALLRPIFILFVWVFVSATIFEVSYSNKKIVPFKELPTGAAATARPIPEFNSLIFAVDTLLPIVDLSQKKNWTVNPLSTSGVHDPKGSADALQSVVWVWRQIPDCGAAALLIFNTFFGWLMTTLFVAGVSGLIRPNRD